MFARSGGWARGWPERKVWAYSQTESWLLRTRRHGIVLAILHQGTSLDQNGASRLWVDWMGPDRVSIVGCIREVCLFEVGYEVVHDTCLKYN